MSIQVGQPLPDATLTEFVEVEGNGCAIGPNNFKVSDLVKGKKIAIFGLPGAYTPNLLSQTCARLCRAL
jgi:glutaredoxin/glutathione-dependent peroxiredoxin